MCRPRGPRVSIRCAPCGGSEIDNGIACNLSVWFEYSLKEDVERVDTSDNALMSAGGGGDRLETRCPV